MRSFLCAAIALSTTHAMAEMAVLQPEGPMASFDTIFNVPSIQSISVDPATGSLFAAVSRFSESEELGAEILHWSLDLIRIAGAWSTQMRVSDLAVSAQGTVFAAGQQVENAVDAEGNVKLGGSVLIVDPAMPATASAEIVSYRADPKVRNLISRYNQVAFDGKGWVYLAAPTQFNVVLLPESPQTGIEGVIYPFFKLHCGAPAQLSLFEAFGRTGYAASTIDGAQLETGFVNLDAKPTRMLSPDCFRVTNVYEHKEPPPTLNSVVHAVLTTGGTADAILALEPNTGFLHLLGLDPGQRLVRSSAIDLQAKSGALTVMSASADGAVILVGGSGANEILRLRREGDAVVRVGSLATGPGLKLIEVSSDGALAVAVMQDQSGQDRVHVIRNPGRLEDGARALVMGGESLRLIQVELNKRGLAVGPADGILGPRTLSAVQQLSSIPEMNGESSDSEIQSWIEGVFLNRPSGG